MTRSSAKSCTTAALWTTTMSVKNVRKWGDVSSGRTGRNASSSKLQQKKNGIHTFFFSQEFVFFLIGVPGGIRTPDLQVRSLPFYPAKLRVHVNIVMCSSLCFLINSEIFFVNLSGT